MTKRSVNFPYLTSEELEAVTSLARDPNVAEAVKKDVAETLKVVTDRIAAKPEPKSECILCGAVNERSKIELAERVVVLEDQLKQGLKREQDAHRVKADIQTSFERAITRASGLEDENKRLQARVVILEKQVAAMLPAKPVEKSKDEAEPQDPIMARMSRLELD